MLKKILIFSSLVGAITFSPLSFSSEEKLKLKQDYPDTYIVVKGDTLWDISALFLDNPWYWPKLWQINPEIDNPHLIYPGDKLSLSWHNGNPVLSVKALQKLSPKTRVVVKKAEAVPTLAPSLVVPYLKSDKLIDHSEYKNAHRVLGTSDGRKFLSSNERVYVDAKLEHKKWGIYRLVNEFTRKDSKDVSNVLKAIGVAELAESSDDMSGLKVIKQQQEIAINDLILPISTEEVESDLTTTFYPRPAPKDLQASILGSIDGGQYVAINQVAVLDRGTNDGLQQGSMFALKEVGHVVKGKKGDYKYDQDGDKLDGIKLPDTTVGELIVIRPYEHFSLGLITKSEIPIHTRILAVSPEQEK